jgi:serine/threonine protein kinase
MDPHFEKLIESQPGIRTSYDNFKSPAGPEAQEMVKKLLESSPNNSEAYEELEFLGKGISRVTKVRFKPTGEVYARKRYELPENEASRRKIRESLALEVKFLVHFSYLDIFPTFHGSFEAWDDARNMDTFNIVIEPVADRDLGAELRSAMVQFNPAKPPKPPDAQRQRQFRYWSRFWLSELGEVFHYLHGLGPKGRPFVRHRDIKLENFLVVTRPNPKYDNQLSPFLVRKDSEHATRHIILSDFGISKDFPSITQAITNSSQPTKNFFSAPEVLRDGSSHGLESDVFSLGAVMLEILAVMRNVPSLAERTKTWGSGTEYGLKASELQTSVTSSLADQAWLQGLDEEEHQYFKWALDVIERMVREHPNERLKAREIAFLFQFPERGNYSNQIPGLKKYPKSGLSKYENMKKFVVESGVLRDNRS